MEQAFGMLDIFIFSLIEEQNRYCQSRSGNHGPECDSRLLKRLLKSTRKAGIWPAPPLPYTNMSFEDIKARLWDLDIYVEGCVADVHCRLALGEEMEEIEDRFDKQIGHTWSSLNGFRH